MSETEAIVWSMREWIIASSRENKGAVVRFVGQLHCPKCGK
jgi:hypothetical protein